MRENISEIQDSVVKILENQPGIVENVWNPIRLIVDDPVHGPQPIGPMWERIYTMQQEVIKTFDRVTEELTELTNNVAKIEEIRGQATSAVRRQIIGKITHVCCTLSTMCNTIVGDQEDNMKDMGMIQRDVAAILKDQVRILAEIKQCDAELADDPMRSAVQFSSAWESVPKSQISTLSMHKTILANVIPGLQNYVDTIVEIQEEARKNSDAASA